MNQYFCRIKIGAGSDLNEYSQILGSSSIDLSDFSFFMATQNLNNFSLLSQFSLMTYSSYFIYLFRN